LVVYLGNRKAVMGELLADAAKARREAARFRRAAALLGPPG